MGIRTRQAAFTLIELLVVVALVAIFALVGIPSYESMTTTNRMATEINGLLADLQYARSEAIMRGVNVNICASSDQLTCNTPSNGWNEGWIVLATGDSTPLRVHLATDSTDVFTSAVTGGVGVMNTITFNRNGFSSDTGAITLNDQAGTVTHRQCLNISMVGRVSHDSGSSC